VGKPISLRRLSEQIAKHTSSQLSDNCDEGCFREDGCDKPVLIIIIGAIIIGAPAKTFLELAESINIDASSALKIHQIRVSHRQKL
jgi:hypothetical protein